jgi:hypothetical protein
MRTLLRSVRSGSGGKPRLPNSNRNRSRKGQKALPKRPLGLGCPGTTIARSSHSFHAPEEVPGIEALRARNTGTRKILADETRMASKTGEKVSAQANAKELERAWDTTGKAGSREVEAGTQDFIATLNKAA